MRYLAGFALCVSLCSTGHAQGVPVMVRSCGAVEQKVPQPDYSIQRREHDTVGALELYVATHPLATEGPEVIRIACKLSKSFPKERIISAWIFDDRTAARRIALAAQDQKRHGEYLWHLRAYYERDRDTASEYVEYLVPIYDNHLFMLLRQKIVLSP